MGHHLETLVAALEECIAAYRATEGGSKRGDDACRNALAAILQIKGAGQMAHGKAEELTGNRRYKHSQLIGHGGIRSLMILQVEVSYWDYSKRQWAVRWRDATPADLPRQEVVHA